MEQERCPYCGRWFKAESGKGSRQITCGEAKCQARHKRKLDRRWREGDPGWVEGRQQKVRKWAEGCGYWGEYRAKNPGYVKRNRAQTRERMRRQRGEEKRTRAIQEDPVGYLRGLKSRCGEDVCKTGSGGGDLRTGKGVTADDVCKTGSGGAVLVGVVDYLVARELFAKQEVLDLRPWREVKRGSYDARGATLGLVGPAVCGVASAAAGAGKTADGVFG